MLQVDPFIMPLDWKTVCDGAGSPIVGGRSVLLLGEWFQAWSWVCWLPSSRSSRKRSRGSLDAMSIAEKRYLTSANLKQEEFCRGLCEVGQASAFSRRASLSQADQYLTSRDYWPWESFWEMILLKIQLNDQGSRQANCLGQPCLILTLLWLESSGQRNGLEVLQRGNADTILINPPPNFRCPSKQGLECKLH